MRDAAAEVDGVNLQRKVRYDAWDAESLAGCVCDAGWEGHACGVQQCPLGSDPLDQRVETQQILITATHQDEVQRFTFAGAGADDDEVQTFSITVPPPLSAPSGAFTLVFDTSYSQSDCNLCYHGRRSSEMTDLVHIPIDLSLADSLPLLIDDIQSKLLDLPNIDDVVVTGNVVSTGAQSGYVFFVTFTGDRVGGDVTELVVVDESTFAFASPMTAAEVTAGSEIQGYVVLTYDNTASVQLSTLGFVGAASSGSVSCAGDITNRQSGTCLGIASSPGKVKSVLEALPNVDTVDVTFSYVGGPGIVWLVTFSGGQYCQGDLDQVAVASTALTAVSVSSITPVSLVASTVQHGHFLVPTTAATVSVTWGGDTWTQDVTVATTAAALEAALEQWSVLVQGTLTDTYRIGQVSVTAGPPAGMAITDDDYSGERAWDITFHSVKDSVETVAVSSVAAPLDASPSVAGSVGGAAVTLASDLRGPETWVLRTAVDNLEEVQRFALGEGGTDVDEVLRLTIRSTGGNFLQGLIRLSFDSRGTKCTLCKEKSLRQNSGAAFDLFRLPAWNPAWDPLGGNALFDSSDATHREALALRVAAHLLEGLFALPNVGRNQVTVSVNAVVLPGPAYEYQCLITFSGVFVGGDIDASALSYLLWPAGEKVLLAYDAEVTPSTASYEYVQRGPHVRRQQRRKRPHPSSAPRGTHRHD
jgi:hypothetical protein